MKQFIFGFVAGGLVSGVITGLVVKHKYEKKCQDEISEMRQHYISEYVPKKEAVMKDMEKPSPESIVETYRTADDREIVDRAELERPSEDAPEEYYEEDPEKIEAYNAGVDDLDYQRNNEGKDPEIIPESEAGTHGFDVSYLTYYMVDKIFVDGQEQVIDDPKDLLGNSVEFEEFLQREDTSEEIIIRNFRYGTDYSITKHNEKWDS